MVVFIEDTLIENFLITYFILKIVFSFLNEQKSKTRLICACLFASFMALFYPLLKLNGILFLILKLFVGYIIVLIAYKTNSLKRHLFFLTMFFIITAIYGGINMVVYFSIYGNFSSSKKLPTVLIICLLFVISYFLNQCKNVLYAKKKINNFIYDVVLTNDSINIKTKAYLDTGNILVDNLTKKPIILVNFKIFAQLNENFKVEQILTNSLNGLKYGHFVPVKTVNATDKLIAFQIDSIKLIQNEKTQVIYNPIIALSKVRVSGFDCDVILNSKILGD